MKKIICVLLAALILAASLPAFAVSASGTETVPAFQDVAEGSWYYNCVTYCAKNGIMVGMSDTKFEPNTGMSRAMFVAVLYRLSGESAPQTASPFADVAEGTWYADAVKWAHQNGIASGVSPTKFAPNDPVTREQMCAFMVRYSDYMEYELTLDRTLTADMYVFEKVIYAMMFNEELEPAFTDIYDISNYAMSPVIQCAEYGIVSGMPDGSFEPKGNATRAQVCSVILRFIRALTSESNEVSEENNTAVFAVNDQFGKYAEIHVTTKEIDENTVKITTLYNVLDGSEPSYVSEGIYNADYPAPVMYKMESSDGTEESSFYDPEKMYRKVTYDGLTVEYYYKNVESEDGVEISLCEKYVETMESHNAVYELLYDGFDCYGYIKTFTYEYPEIDDNYVRKTRYEVSPDGLSSKISMIGDNEPVYSIELVCHDDTNMFTFTITASYGDEKATYTTTVDLTDPDDPQAIYDMNGDEEEDIDFTEFTLSIYVSLYMILNL